MTEPTAAQPTATPKDPLPEEALNTVLRPPAEDADRTVIRPPQGGDDGERTVIREPIQPEAGESTVIREPLEPAQYNERYATLNFDLTDWGFSGGDADILRNHLHTAGFQNASAVSDPALDTILEEAVATSDPGVRQQLYTEVQQWNQEQVAIVPLYVPAVITVTSPRVTGLQFDIDGRPLFGTASIAPAS